MSELPDSWLTCSLGEVIDYGKTLKAEPVEIPDDAWVLELEDIEKDTSKVLQRLTFRQRQSKSTKNRFVAGDILYGKLRPYLNKVVRADQDGYCTTEIIPIKSNEIVEGAYLFRWLKTPTFIDYVTSVSHGLNMPRLGTDAGKQAPFVLAPLNEQKRIADKLDAVLARVDACRDRLDRIPAILKRFRQSVLAAATSGKLTEDWRVKNDVCNEWSISTVGDVAFVTKLAGFEYTKFVNYREGGDLKVLKAENAGKLGFKYTDFSTVYSKEVSMLTRSKLQEGDVLMVFVGAGTGQVARVPSGNSWFLGPNIAMIRTNSELLNSAYLEHYCRSQKGFGEISSFIKSVAQPSLSMKTIRQVQILLPSTKEQDEIVRRVDSLFAYADRLEARYTAARAQVEKLTPATLAKAFRGELVPQDPNDEPASELLARIKAQHGEQPASKPKKSRKVAA